MIQVIVKILTLAVHGLAIFVVVVLGYALASWASSRARGYINTYDLDRQRRSLDKEARRQRKKLRKNNTTNV